MRLVSTSNVLYYCGSVCSGLAKRVKGKILLSSTSEVHGDPEARFETMYNVLLTCVCVCVQVHPQVEEYWGHVNPIGPRACYDEGKRVAETMAYAYAKQVQR